MVRPFRYIKAWFIIKAPPICLLLPPLSVLGQVLPVGAESSPNDLFPSPWFATSRSMSLCAVNFFVPDLRRDSLPLQYVVGRRGFSAEEGDPSQVSRPIQDGTALQDVEVNEPSVRFEVLDLPSPGLEKLKVSPRTVKHRGFKHFPKHGLLGASEVFLFAFGNVPRTPTPAQDLFGHGLEKAQPRVGRDSFTK